MGNWADGGVPKIDRAKELIADARAARDEYVSGGALEVMTTATGNPAMRVNTDPPLRLGAIAGDAIHNLRAALDVLWVLAIEANGVTPTTHEYFPIAGSANGFKDMRTREKRKLLRPLWDLADAIKPYKGGSDSLWRLNRLDIKDKHYVVTPVACALMREVRTPTHGYRAIATVSRGLVGITTELKIIHAGQALRDVAHVDVGVQVPGLTECHQLLPLLADLCGAVEDVVDRFQRASLIA